MEHYKSRNNDYFHFTNPHDDASEFVDDDDDDDDDYGYDESQHSDVDDDRSCDFNFHTYRPLGFNLSPPANSQTSGVLNRNDTVESRAFDNGALIFQLDSTMKNISDKLQYRIEGIGTQISHLEDESCTLGNYVEDVKNSEEMYHETTHQKLRQMQTILQEVHDVVLNLRDKHEIAATRLQLATLYGSKRDEVNISPQSSCSSPLFKHRSNELTLSQGVSYHPVAFAAHEITGQQYILPPNRQSHTPQSPHFIQSHLSNRSFIHVSNLNDYKSEFHAKYMPESASYSNNANSFFHPQEESSGSNYNYTPVAQTLPHALPTAIDVKEESRFKEIGDTVQLDDIVDKVTGMGFRRDLVRACVRKLILNGSRVDLYSVLDKMMNYK